MVSLSSSPEWWAAFFVSCALVLSGAVLVPRQGFLSTHPVLLSHIISHWQISSAQTTSVAESAELRHCFLSICPEDQSLRLFLPTYSKGVSGNILEKNGQLLRQERTFFPLVENTSSVFANIIFCPAEPITPSDHAAHFFRHSWAVSWKKVRRCRKKEISRQKGAYPQRLAQHGANLPG